MISARDFINLAAPLFCCETVRSCCLRSGRRREEPRVALRTTGGGRSAPPRDCIREYCRTFKNITIIIKLLPFFLSFKRSYKIYIMCNYIYFLSFSLSLLFYRILNCNVKMQINIYINCEKKKKNVRCYEELQ